ncbi:MAG: NUDIX hydrolase [Nanoarchaeota archaeon]|nr:NUDIX hydrolase [Nanoarchaeota archaeon]
MILRNRATVIVEDEKGILLVSHSFGKRPNFMLPGGGIKRKELPLTAAVRELHEETNLEATEVKYLFNFKSEYNNHFVFLIKTRGALRKKRETRYISFFNKKTQELLNLSPHVKPIIEHFNKIDIR